VLIKSQKDFYSGLVFVVVGGAFAVGAQSYNVGTAGRMGPGYFPTLLGIILALIGAFVTARSFWQGTPGGDKIGKWAWKPLFFIIAANVLFGVLLGGLPRFGIPSMGLIVAIFGLTIVSSMAGQTFRLRESLVLGAILSVLSYGAFIMLLKLQFQVWPSFISA